MEELETLEPIAANEHRRLIDLRPARSWVCPFDGATNYEAAVEQEVTCSKCGRRFPAREAA